MTEQEFATKALKIQAIKQEHAEARRQENINRKLEKLNKLVMQRDNSELGYHLYQDSIARGIYWFQDNDISTRWDVETNQYVLVEE